MAATGKTAIDTPIGRLAADSGGSAVGVARMDVDASYRGTGALLQKVINEGNERAWSRIKEKIDYTYHCLDLALSPLKAETDLEKRIRDELEKGRRLLFKPNLVNINSIDPLTHAPALGNPSCTEWPFVAALMRWFHDELEISYHQMSLGEAATTMAAVAASYTLVNPTGEKVTTEATIEGRCGDFHGGWGFYFARRYLAECHPPDHRDDPMRGYEESVAGTYLPPGQAGDRLMVYDLNRIYDDLTKGRDVSISDGANFDAITLHKAIVGGDPSDPDDVRDYPGCVLVNVPRLKVHAIALFTNVIKNLGIGLYPMQAAKVGSFHWKYSTPHSAVPGIKSGIPHQVWEAELDDATGITRRSADGTYLVRKTAGMPGTMVDIIKAVDEQDIFMVHVVDAIEAINLDHQGIGLGEKVSEGVVFAGLDPVATDLLCARYMFSNVGLEDAEAAELEDGNGGRFPQRVPLPTVQGENIVTDWGYDCPLSRDISFRYAESRGLGKRQYHVVGSDAISGSPLVSVKGHLGTVSDGIFFDLVTQSLYFDLYKVPWDLQRTSLSYFEAVDRLSGSNVKQQFLEAFDEDGDGIVSYEEFGKKGIFGPLLNLGGRMVSSMGTEQGQLRGSFTMNATLLKCAKQEWNGDGHDLYREFFDGASVLVAMRVSQLEVEGPDPFLPSLVWGKGKWPSLQMASFGQIGASLYGEEFPDKMGSQSLYGSVLFYADLTQNGGEYVGDNPGDPDPEGVHRYVSAVASGTAQPLDFVLYVPAGFGGGLGPSIPNVEETDDPEKILTAVFAGGKEVWPGARPS